MPPRTAHFRSAIRRLSLLSLITAALTYGAIRLSAAADGSTPPPATAFPNPAVDISTTHLSGTNLSTNPSTPATTQTAVFAGGCFWGMEGVFEHLQGVSEVLTGYVGGSADSARYDAVSVGATTHAEAVQITYDPAQITYGQLLKVYFAVAHDPTQLNRQGPDVGAQYRSAIFFADDEQKQVAQSYIDQLTEAQVFDRPIVTQLSPFDQFYAAEDYHQDFVKRNPYHPYVVVHDLPQIVRLREQFPELYEE